MSKKNREYLPEFKIKFVFEAMTYPDGVTAYCRVKGIKDSRYYAWREAILKNSNAIFKKKNQKEKNELEQLKLKLQSKD